MPITLNGDTGIVSPAIDVTTPITVSDGGTGLTSVGTSGNVLTSNGTAWTSAAPAGGFSNMQVFTSSGTFTVPTGITKVKVTVVGGGGNGGNTSGTGTAQGGAGGGAAIEYISGLTPGNTVSVTVGAAAGTSSFGAFCSATGGANGTETSAYNTGAGTGSGGNFNVSGGIGGLGALDAQNSSQRMSFGGMGPLGLGFGYPQDLVNADATQPATGFGAGGTGAAGSTTGRSGSAGAPGVVIVEY
jgi:hypothetical protein